MVCSNMKYPQALLDLIESFSKLPSVGKKTAERYALYVFMHMDETDIIDFTNSLISVKKDIHTCPECGNICEEGLCSICNDKNRNHKIILVVENVKDLFVIEKMNEFKGIYHVLNGSINLSKGINVDNLNIESLVNRIKNNQIEEIILGTNATLEGETTARYIRELLRDNNIKITRLAHGLPVGGDLSYVDEMTLIKAIDGRRDY